MLLAHRHTVSSGKMMRMVGRSITRCPEPYCSGQLFVQDEQREWGHWERSLVCSLCGREFRAQAPDDARARRTADGGYSLVLPDGAAAVG